MKAVQFTQFGGPEVLEVADVPEPRPDLGQIRISVRAAAVNPVDWKMRQGMMGGDLPQRTGREVAARDAGTWGAAIAADLGLEMGAAYAYAFWIANSRAREALASSNPRNRSSMSASSEARGTSPQTNTSPAWF